MELQKSINLVTSKAMDSMDLGFEPRFSPTGRRGGWRNIFSILMACLVLCGCKEDSEVAVLEVSASSFTDLGSEGTILSVDIACSDFWTAVSSAPSWCSVTPQTGTGGRTITVQIAENPDIEPREAVVTVSSNGMNKEIEIGQMAVDLKKYHYRLPVIFHVLYEDKNDPLQYVDHARLAEILEAVNAIYNGNDKSPEMNLTFTLATTDPDGKVLDTPGVEYIPRTDYPIDCREFMGDQNSKYTSLLWDPNRFINIMIYNFAAEDPNFLILGISHFPYSVKGRNFLEGLNETEYTWLELENLQFAYCVSINSLYIYEQRSPTQYNPMDASVTMAHELGHYLGLYHSFAEDEDGSMLNGCEDTDYCEDTPTYNRILYIEWINELIAEGVYDLREFFKRKNCKTGEEFLSTNMMDYEFSENDRFTQNQYSRIRHVLMHSPLIPGPKEDPTRVNAVHDGKLDLPIRVMQ